ncbi:hypothetical protein ACRQ84_07510 [Enterobacter ludwigii]
MLRPSTSFRNVVVRALFAQKEFNSPIEDLLWVADDNKRKNYLCRFEPYLKNSECFSIYDATIYLPQTCHPHAIRLKLLRLIAKVSAFFRRQETS